MSLAARPGIRNFQSLLSRTSCAFFPYACAQREASIGISSNCFDIPEICYILFYNARRGSRFDAVA